MIDLHILVLLVCIYADSIALSIIYVTSSMIYTIVFSVAGIRMNETADCETDNANNSRGVLKKSEIEVDLSSDDWTTLPTLLR